MSSVLIECWNCGQKLNIRTDKVALARCGNCQQMIVEGGSPPQPQPKPSPPTPRSAPRDEPALPPRQQQKTQYQPAKVSGTIRAITSKELLLGLGLSIAVAAIVRFMEFFIFSDRRFVKVIVKSYFPFDTPLQSLRLVRTILILTLFFFLSLSQRFARSARYAVCTVFFITVEVVLDIYSIEVLHKQSFNFSEYMRSFNTLLLPPILLLTVGLVIMDVITRRLFRAVKVG